MPLHPPVEPLRGLLEPSVVSPQAPSSSPMMPKSPQSQMGCEASWVAASSESFFAPTEPLRA